MIKRDLTKAELRRLLCYNPFSGNFRWRVSSSNRIHVGDIAGTIRIKRRFGRKVLAIRINGVQYYTHRLAFLYMRGHWPHNEIDHRDGNGTNNRWLNLREATHSQNQANCGPQKNNKLGIKRVCYDGKRKKYQARIMVRGQRMYLGSFNSIDEASKAYQQAANKYFGEFARYA